MKKSQKKGNLLKNLTNIAVMCIYLFIGGAVGFYIGSGIGNSNLSGAGAIFNLILSLFLFMLAFYIQIIIHEGGHLIFGLLTGYKFSSFRIASFMIMREDGKMKFKRLTVAGTGGQCLMSPPDCEEDKMQFVLYNLGGCLLNLISIIVFLPLYFVTIDIVALASFFLSLCLSAAIYVLLNGIPLNVGGVSNDGMNTLSLLKNKKAVSALWLQLKINDELSRGKRLRDLPSDWFYLPNTEDMKNLLIASIGIFYLNRLMDEGDFAKTVEIGNSLLEMDTNIIDLHKKLLISDLIFCELIGENSTEKIDEMMTKEQKKIMKMMQAFPSVIRTNYALALIYEKDRSKADKLLKTFEKIAKTYPYKGDIQSERELIQKVNEKIAEPIVCEE